MKRLLCAVGIFLFAYTVCIYAAGTEATVKSHNELRTAIKNGYTIIRLEDSITLDDTIEIPGDRNLTIKGNKEAALVSAAGKRHISIGEGSARVTLVDMVFDGKGKGGGIESKARLLNVKDTVIRDCMHIGGQSAPNEHNPFGKNAFGGALYAEGGTVSLSGTTIDGNTVISVGTAGGGGVAVSSGVLKADASTVIQNNTANGIKLSYGGGVFSQESPIEISGGSRVESNRSVSDKEAFGGGVYIADAKLRLDDSSAIAQNLATSAENAYGGGVYAYGYEETPDMYAIDNQSVVTNNNVKGGFTAVGGGIYTMYGGMSVQNGSKIENNTAEGGDKGWSGGVYADGQVSVSDNSSLKGNIAYSRAARGNGGTLAYMDVTLKPVQSTAKTGMAVATATPGPGAMAEPKASVEPDKNVLTTMALPMGKVILDESASAKDADKDKIAGSDMGSVVSDEIAVDEAGAVDAPLGSVGTDKASTGKANIDTNKVETRMAEPQYASEPQVEMETGNTMDTGVVRETELATYAGNEADVRGQEATVAQKKENPKTSDDGGIREMVAIWVFTGLLVVLGCMVGVVSSRMRG